MLDEVKHGSLAGGASNGDNTRVPTLERFIGEMTKIAGHAEIKSFLKFCHERHDSIITHCAIMVVMTKRITGLDTLRLFAIVLIVIYHVARTSLPGGFVAVEIFFVLSGFLIASKLLAGYKKGEKMSFWRFLWSRVKKFYPAMLACVLLTLALGYFVNPDVMTRARENTLYALTFTTNIADIVRGTTYESQIMPNVFQHFWFVALILQAYIIIFVLMKLIMGVTKKYRQGTKMVAIMSGLLAIVSYGLMALFGGHYGLLDRAYFGPDTHIGGFCLGVLLAAILALRKKDLAPTKSRWGRAGWLGLTVATLGGVTGLAFMTSYSDVRVFYFELLAVAAVTLVVIVAILKLQTSKPVRNKLLLASEYLGSLSFYIYLFHWPLFILLTALWGGR